MLLNKTLQSSTLRLAFIYVIVFSAGIFGLLGYVYWSTLDYLHEKSDHAIKAEHALLLKTYDQAGRDGLIALLNRRVSDTHFDDWAYLLVDSSLDYVAGNLPAWPKNEGTERTLLQATSDILPDGYHLLLGRKAGDQDRFGEKIAIGLASGAGLFLILAAAAGISTSRRSVARIEAINVTSREIMRAGLGERIPVRGTGDEWDGLARNLNSMLDRIQELVESNRQVSDNVAHDLRTPLTRMRGRLERACDQELDLSQYRSLVNDTIVELDDILRTFSSLLRISQIEVHDRTAAFHNIDLSEIAREVVELFDPTAEEKAVRLRLSGAQRVCVVGDRDLRANSVLVAGFPTEKEMVAVGQNI